MLFFLFFKALAHITWLVMVQCIVSLPGDRWAGDRGSNVPRGRAGRTARGDRAAPACCVVARGRCRHRDLMRGDQTNGKNIILVQTESLGQG